MATPRRALLFICSAALVLAYAQTPATAEKVAREGYKRIISLAPSITETLFALGTGDRVAGVTRYCLYPPEARTKEKIGGYYDTNYEAALSLNPDLVILFPEHEKQITDFKSLGVDVMVVDHSDINGILDSIIEIGRAVGAKERAHRLVAALKAGIKRVRKKTENLPRPGVLVSIGRNMGSGDLSDLFISGEDGYYDSMITIAGGMNVYKGRTANFPAVSAEGILRLNPQVIIDVIPDLEKRGWDEKDILKEWQKVGGVDAVKNGRVYVFSGDYTVIPGPRFILTLEKMARAIHPEIDWDG